MSTNGTTKDSIEPRSSYINEILNKGSDFLFENSAFLIIGTLAALIFAASDHHTYHELIHEPHGGVTFHFIVNDVLMCFFFAIAAKEIWEAMLPGGTLSSPKKAMTPIMATVGGVAGPALLYFGLTKLFNQPDAVRGWAIPCATDIAFSYLVARLIFGKSHPAIPFLLLLAIVDDAVGLLILAVFYPTGSMDLATFSICLIGAVGFNLLLRKFGVKNFWFFLIFAGPLAWYGFYKGGIHPALALVPLIPTLPHAKRDEGLFAEDHKEDALNAFEHWWKKPVELILMMFGLANAGVVLSSFGSTTSFVTAGLLVGKPVGIFICTWIAVHLLRLSLPEGMKMKDVFVVGCVAGIGFTVALFVSTVAFEPGALQDAAKMGALLSFAAAILSFLSAMILKVGRYSKSA
ncbi:sodium:proton antiporter [Candidatus Peregrinibacteria bacterium]|nr:sodium:proton antiporter [Candidatus Peregrinibacteria bacterium]